MKLLIGDKITIAFKEEGVTKELTVTKDSNKEGELPINSKLFKTLEIRLPILKPLKFKNTELQIIKIVRQT